MNGERNCFQRDDVGDFKLLETIGKGAFAVVKAGIHKPSLAKVAIKILDKTKVTEDKLGRELIISKDMDFPYIIKYYDFIEEKGKHYLIMERIEGRNLLEIVNNDSFLSVERIKRYFTQMIAAIDYMHNSLHTAHRDIKLENILIDPGDNIRIIDFGLSNIYEENVCLRTAVGSPPYAPPEIIQGQKYTNSVDVWSAGVVLYAMVYKALPFIDNNPNKLMSMILLAQPKYNDDESFSVVNDLIKRMLSKNPESRITIDGILAHPFIKCDSLISKFARIINNYFQLIVDDSFWLSIDGKIKSLESYEVLNERQIQVTRSILTRVKICEMMKSGELESIEIKKKIPKAETNIKPNNTKQISNPLPPLRSNHKESPKQEPQARKILALTTSIQRTAVHRSRTRSFSQSKGIDA